ncbi:alcohol acetyltransferase domain-containing protein [Sarocladium implicatum]|nr:alcohol acetyltransferase domain-containing protein [Sarocladium implicatum]
MGARSCEAIRPLSGQEQFSSARHHLGIYHCVIVTARYEHKAPLDQNKPHPIYNALITLIRRHAALRVGIADDHTNKPYYCHIPKVDLRNHVHSSRLKCTSLQDYEKKLADLQSRQHKDPFQKIASIPPWRLVIVTPEFEGSPQPTHQDFMFAFHHSMIDGPSAKVFHEQLVAALNYPSCSFALEEQQTYELDFLAKPDLPPPREEVIPENLTKTYIAGVLWKAMGPAWLQPTPDPWWSGKKVDFALPFTTRMLPVDIPPDTLTALLKGCRAHSVTLTSLLHAMILASLARRLDAFAAPAFKSQTPIDLRLLPLDGVAKAYKDTLSNCVTASDEDHPALAVSAFRSSGADLDSLIWSNAQRVGKVLSDRRSSLPVNDPVMLFKFVSDMIKWYREKDGKQRGRTWELSNIGIVKGVPFESEDHQSWRITRVFFSNSAAVTGPAISVNVASVPGENLTMSIVWQESVVEEELASGLAADLVAFAARFRDEGTFAG